MKNIRVIRDQWTPKLRRVAARASFVIDHRKGYRILIAAEKKKEEEEAEEEEEATRPWLNQR